MFSFSVSCTKETENAQLNQHLKVKKSGKFPHAKEIFLGKRCILRIPSCYIPSRQQTHVDIITRSCQPRATKYLLLTLSGDMSSRMTLSFSGLRGHLQDELLRIQTMLAQDDPELRVQFCVSCTWVRTH